MRKTYAGIGSRQTPDRILKIMKQMASEYEDSGWKLRTGGADGADNAFASGVRLRYNGTVFLPWTGFNNWDDSLYTVANPNDDGFKIAEKYHPAWGCCSPAVKRLHARNSHIILGYDCKFPADLVICWCPKTPLGEYKGGTAQGLRIAEDYNIPIINLWGL